MRPRTVVTVAASSVTLAVFVYAFVLLPLELGQGLLGGYSEIGPLGIGALGILVWLALGVFLVAVARRRVERYPSKTRTTLYSLVVASVVTFTSYPLMVMWVFIGIDYAETPVAPRDQIILIVLASWLYTWALAAAGVCTLVAAAVLGVLRVRRASRN